MAVDERRIAVLGTGRIGEALISGLLSSGWRRPEDIVASSRRAERLVELAERYGIATTMDNVEAAAGAALVVVSVKPQDIEGLLGQIGPAISAEQTVLSVAAATPTAAIEGHLAAGVPVVRAMPNTPSTVHEGIAGLCAGAHADDAHVTLAEEALAHLGSVVRVPERHMDAVTAVSGSGPAYFALLAEAMIEAGLLLGLSREISTQLVIQTMLGTAKQLRDEGLHPVELREMVTSPGGTTIAAIRELESAGVRAAFLNAIQAAMTRARELAAGVRLARQQRGRQRRQFEATSGRERVEDEHRVGDADVLEERVALLERPQHGATPRHVCRAVGPRERAERIRDRRRLEPLVRDPRRNDLGILVASEREQGERGAVAADRSGGIEHAGIDGSRGVGARSLDGRRPSTGTGSLRSAGPSFPAAPHASSCRTRPRHGGAGHGPRRRGRASARRAPPPTTRPRCPRAGSPPARPARRRRRAVARAPPRPMRASPASPCPEYRNPCLIERSVNPCVSSFHGAGAA